LRQNYDNFYCRLILILSLFIERRCFGQSYAFANTIAGGSTQKLSDSQGEFRPSGG
jgi:hypothetical protein